MRRIGLTQRVDEFPHRSETRDGLDQSWAPLLENLDLCPVPLCNSIKRPSDYLDALGLDGVIITGGNDIQTAPTPTALPLRDRFEYDVLTYCLGRRLPVLGVCRGMQIINVFFRGTLSQITDHVATRHPMRHGDGLRSVNSYHNFCIYPRDLGKELSPIAHCEDGSIEAFRHDNGFFHGIMWHPEREIPSDSLDVELLCAIFEANPPC